MASRAGAALSLAVTLAVTLAATLVAAAARLDVKVDGTSVRIVADAARLADVLDRLSEATGMEVIYESTPPGALVTAELEASTHAEAVVRLFDGLAVSYALQLDASGERVTALWVAGQARRPRRAQRTAAPRKQPARRLPTVETNFEALGQPEEEPAPEQFGAPSAAPEAAPVVFPTPLTLPPSRAPGATPTPPDRRSQER